MDEAADERFLLMAITAATANPRAPFGAVVADADGLLVSEGCNRSHENPTLHGEIDAIHNAIAAAPRTDWRRATLYATAEPCPMCMAAVLWAGIGRVVYGTSIPTLKRLGWRQLDLRAAEVAERATGWPAVELVGGVLEAECDRLFGCRAGR